MTNRIDAKDAHIATLTDQLAKAETRAAAAEARAVRAEQRAEKAEGRIDTLLALLPVRQDAGQGPSQGVQKPPRVPTQVGEGGAQPDDASRFLSPTRKALQALAEAGALGGEPSSAVSGEPPPQSEFQALVEAGGAVSDGTGLSAATARGGKGWRRWLRWRS
jgi:hypothetical protein